MRKAVITDKAPRPIGPYSQAIVDGDLLFLAGQGPIDPATGVTNLGDIRSQTKLTLANIAAILDAAGSSLDNVIRCNVFLKDIGDFAAMNEVYAATFTAPYPARTTIQAGALPGGISVEIECVARR
jgi:2-iminobutanoate/2-iminopropanoate deaminase